MGIYDRDYYRNEGPGFLDSLWPSGLICRWLIGINVAIFILQMLTTSQGGDGIRAGSSSWLTDWLTLDTAAVLRGEVWRLLTYAFLHASFGHILFNMLFLWW